jgi:hypothetical protein
VGAHSGRLRAQLGLTKIEELLVELADGSRLALDVVGPVEIRFKNRRASVDALVLPGDSDVLLGAVPLELMDVLIDARNQRLIVNPAHPDQAQLNVKGLEMAEARS